MRVIVLIVCAAAAVMQPAPTGLSRQIDAIAARALTDGPVAGLSVAVVRHGEVLHANGYGVRDVVTGAPVTTATVFNAASVGKMITVIAALRLVEQNRLALDADIRPLLPALEGRLGDRAITLRQLLSHTSGLNDYVAADYERLRRTREPLEPSFVLDHIRSRPLDFSPGDHWIYSNTGFYLAGLLIEQAAGRPWSDVVLQDVVRPLGLDGVTLCDDAGAARTVGYDVDGTGFGRSIEDGERGVRGDAGLCATAADLARLPAALASSRVLSRASLESMRQPTVLSNGIAVDYGLGVARGSLEGHALWGHLGGSPGSNIAALVHYPDDEVSIAVLVNTRRGSIGALMIEADIARLVLGLGPPALDDRQLPSEAQARYEGEYVGDRSGTRYRIATEGPRLVRRSEEAGAAPLPLLYQGDDVFGRTDWPMDRFLFHVIDGRAAAYSAYYNGLFDGFYRRDPATRPE